MSLSPESSRGESAEAACGSLRLDPRRCLYQPSAEWIVSVCALNQRRDQYRGALPADTQNASDLIGGVSKSGDRYVDHTMFDMVQSLTINDSLKFGKAVLGKLGNINKLHKTALSRPGLRCLKRRIFPPYWSKRRLSVTLKRSVSSRRQNSSRRWRSRFWRGFGRISQTGRRWRDADSAFTRVKRPAHSQTTDTKTPFRVFIVLEVLVAGPDLNRRPSGYEPDELPGCSTPRPSFYSCRNLLLQI